MDSKARGEHVNAKDLKKHKNDVFQMFQIVPEGERVEVTGEVADAVDRFLEEIVKEDIIFVNLGINSDMQTEVAALRETYVRV
ncbi:hypothetical protein [Butyrivibrio sp. YAB3001]|uniref:hypothetical protein n=1 Tax=Butyrivibrio sp. YAB3001 TaxID=1520812 RepID=UPI0008F68D91|nr:hypothetical protein [Butyrivibrio sp. YAB3001]SFD05279.1 hypothetical protein SAMN02910398_03904 [Butyrivibrio sp. YAB3001]